MLNALPSGPVALDVLEPDVAFVVRVWNSRLLGGAWGILEFWGPWRLRGGAAVDDDADEAVELTMLLDFEVSRRKTGTALWT